MAEHSDDVFHHVRDFTYLELPQFLGGQTAYLPRIHIPFYGDFQITKFMVLQTCAGLVTLFIFTGLAWHVRSRRTTNGWFWNLWETIALFLRDEVVRPAVGIGHDHHDDHGHEPHGHGEHAHGDHGHAHHGHAAAPSAYKGPLPTGDHPADKFLPYIWSAFFYILFANLFGAIPWLGSATGAISVTAALAFTTFIMVVVAGSKELGVGGFLKALVPSMDLPGVFGFALKLLIWMIEFVGLIVKHMVLSVRLFANIMAGHTVIAVILGFIAQVADPAVAADYPWLFYVVTPASTLGQLFIGFLEFFVAFLQAYVFALMSSLFIGAAIHPH